VNALTTLLEATTTTAPRAAEPQLLDLDGTVFVMLAIFLVLMLILWQFLWKPYLRVRDERVARVDGTRDKAAQLEAEAASRMERIEASLAEARRGGNAETAKLRLEAQAREQQIISEAQQAARALMLEGRAKLDAALAAEKANLHSHTATLAREMAEKALGRSLAS
jgi:F-type H+-transporting ATPase subunit b